MGSHTNPASDPQGAAEAAPRPRKSSDRNMGSHTKSARNSDAETGVTEILDAIRRVVRTLRVASRSAEKEVGLTAAQLFVLHALAKAPALSLNELAERTRTHQSSVSVVVQRLVDRGFVSRGRDPADARRTALSLTPEAHQLLENAPDAPSERLVQALKRLPTGVRSRLASGLARLVHELGASDEPATMFFEDDTAPAPGERSAPARSQRSGAKTDADSAQPNPGSVPPSA